MPWQTATGESGELPFHCRERVGVFTAVWVFTASQRANTILNVNSPMMGLGGGFGPADADSGRDLIRVAGKLLPTGPKLRCKRR